MGSSELQTAYRLEREANLTLRSVDAFPQGFPHQFSFECTFRTRQPPAVPWYLFHITDSYERSQLSVTIDPTRSALQLALPDVDGNLQMATFEHTEVSFKSSQWVIIILMTSLILSSLTNRGTKSRLVWLKIKLRCTWIVIQFKGFSVSITRPWSLEDQWMLPEVI